jgi:hypothetical protein
MRNGSISHGYASVVNRVIDVVNRVIERVR